MSVEEWQDCIRTLCENGVTTLSFTGGEMLMKEGWEDIVRFAAKQTCYPIKTVTNEQGEEVLVEDPSPPVLFMLSNGKIMSDHVLDLCRELNIHLSMSVPGIKAFPQLTCGHSTAEHVFGWFAKAKEKGVVTTAGITVTSENFDELYETVAESLLAGATTILLNRFLPGGRGLKHRELDLTLEQIAAIPVIVDSALKTAGRYGSIGTEYPYCVAEYALETVGLENLTLNTNCGAAKGFFVIGPSGMVRVCNHSPKELAHWKEWRTLIDHPYWQSYVFDRNLPKECEPCPHKMRCDGGCREAAHVCFGSPQAIDPALADDPVKSPS